MFEKDIDLFTNDNIKLAYRGKNLIKLYDTTLEKIFEKYTKKVICWNEFESKEIDFSFVEKEQEKYYISFDDFMIKLQFETLEELFYFELKYC